MGKNELSNTSLLVSLVLVFLATGLYPAPAQDQENGKAMTTYQRARSHYYNDETDQARPLLQEVINNYPGTRAARNANYLLGKNLFKQREQPLEAVKHFYRVCDSYERSNLTDDSLYYIARIFVDQLKQPKMALPYLKTVKAHFSEADFYQRSVDLLEKLKNKHDASPSTFSPGDIPPPRVKLNFEKVDVKDFVSTYAELSGKNFMYEPGLSGKVTLATKQGIPVQELFDVFVQVLEMNGYTAVRDGSVYRIENQKKALRDGPVSGEETSGLKTRLFSLEGLSRSDAKNILSVILPRRKHLKYLKGINRILVTARPSRLETVRRHLDKLREINLAPSRREIIVYSPQYRQANRLGNELNNLLEEFVNQGNYKIVNDKQSNSLFVVVHKSHRERTKNILDRLDRDLVDNLQIKVFELENADEKEVAKKIQNLLNVLPGKMASNRVQIIPDSRQNAVVVSSVSTRVFSMIERVIDDLDSESPEAPESIRVFDLDFAKPAEVADQLRKLISNLPGSYDEDKVHVLGDDRQNAVVVAAASTEVFVEVEKMLEHLDQKNPRKPENVRVYRLEHAKAGYISEALNQLVEVLPGHYQPDNIKILPDDRQRAIVVSAESKKVFPAVKRVIDELDRESVKKPNRHHVYRVHNSDAGPLAEKLNFLFKDSENVDIRVTADEQTNSLIVSAPPDKFNSIKQTIDKLDSPKKQVLVDVFIVEASQDKTRELGIQWGAEGEVEFSGSGREAVMGTRFGLSQRGLFGFNAGLLSRDGENLLSVLHAYEQEKSFEILSTSHLMANENEEASLSVGEIIPLLDETQVTSDGSMNRSYNFENVGIDLEIVPKLSGEQTVTLDLNQKIEEIQSTGEQLGAPSRKSRNINTKVAIPDDLTLVLGGVLSQKGNTTENSVPLLSTLPVLNYFFQSQSNAGEKRNLLIFLTPHILGSRKELREATRALQQSQELEADAVEISDTNHSGNAAETAPVVPDTEPGISDTTPVRKK